MVIPCRVFKDTEIGAVAGKLRGYDPQDFIYIFFKILFLHNLGKPGIDDALVFHIIIERADQFLLLRLHCDGCGNVLQNTDIQILIRRVAHDSHPVRTPLSCGVRPADDFIRLHILIHRVRFILFQFFPVFRDDPFGQRMPLSVIGGRPMSALPPMILIFISLLPVK